LFSPVFLSVPVLVVPAESVDVALVVLVLLSPVAAAEAVLPSSLLPGAAVSVPVVVSVVLFLSAAAAFLPVSVAVLFPEVAVALSVLVVLAVVLLSLSVDFSIVFFLMCKKNKGDPKPPLSGYMNVN